MLDKDDIALLDKAEAEYNRAHQLVNEHFDKLINAKPRTPEWKHENRAWKLAMTRESKALDTQIAILSKK